MAMTSEAIDSEGLRKVQLPLHTRLPEVEKGGGREGRRKRGREWLREVGRGDPAKCLCFSVMCKDEVVI